ncbi:hypothetical protein L493_3301 [Bordetella bronchiseptica 99-R-0433]|nr:hypothetical protein L493_3301 [Bordetella bronchiseptica 99-R-0433]
MRGGRGGGDGRRGRHGVLGRTASGAHARPATVDFRPSFVQYMKPAPMIF